MNEPDISYGNRKLQINITTLLDGLDTEGRREILESIGWDGDFLDWLLDFVVKGEIVGGGWPCDEFRANLIFRLAPLMDEAAREAIEILTEKVASERKNAEECRRAMHQMSFAWPDHTECPECGKYIRLRECPGREYKCTHTKDRDTLADDIVRRVREGRKINSLADLMKGC